jgi:ribA/ribD-fused uncharacterized protein
MRITDRHIFFWSSIYSNWHPCEFTVDGITFNCSEQYFMYKKALHFNDNENANKILLESHPREQKKLGKKVRNFNTDEWDLASYEIMVEAVYEKFNQNDDLKHQLLKTGDKVLVEASPYDIIWGIGMSEEDDMILDEKNWKGKNLLGKALCEVRERLSVV